MSSRVAPWLDGLTEAWEVPQKPNASNTTSSTTHDADSPRDNTSRIPRPSLGSRTSSSRPDSISRNSTLKTRNPLAPLTKNDTNTLRRQQGVTHLYGSRSMSEASEGSGEACGTVQQRSKSASPEKKQETLEWKRRLMHGGVGYGDQTDLFGPTGLENIFAPSKGPENEEPKAKASRGWLQQRSDTSVMPSSPPPWPSSFNSKPQVSDGSALDSGLYEAQPDDSVRQTITSDGDDSFRSNPFGLESSDGQYPHHSRNSTLSPPPQSSPDKAFVEPTQDEETQNRTVSGQTELEQEDFSPVFVSKHTTVNGQVDYAALDSHLVKQFQSRKVSLRHPSQNHPEHTTNEEAIDADRSAFTDGPQSDSLAADPDLSFSENLPTGSPFPNLGHNVQFARGGYSQQGSFKERPLSPDASRTGDSLDLDTGAMSSPLPPPGQLPPAPTPPHPPTTPVQVEEPKSRSSGSPLKLFAAHDTFTNARLMRRMSQLNPDGTLKHAPASDKEMVSNRTRVASNGSAFGNGELDHHTFDAEITVTSASDSDQSSGDRSPGSEVPVPGSKMPLNFKFEVSPSIDSTFKMKRKLSNHSTATSKVSTLQRPTGQEVENDFDVEPSTEVHHPPRKPLDQETRQYSEAKRPPTSPFKNPTPKRRRTLHASELESGIQTMNDSYHSQLQEALGSRKRKDARQGETQNKADPATLAHRKILRPRNPTPSQKQRRQQIHAELKEAAEEFAEQEPEKLEAVMEQIDSSMASDDSPTLEQQAQTLASEVAAFTFKVQRPSGELVERKRSVTTQDFLDEAMMVMNLIRAKARPQSNLGSVEESDAEAFRQSLHADEPQQDGSLLSVSRPPSREGSGWRSRAPVQTNARVISHLRKFEETEEVDDTNFIANSIASLQVEDEDHVNEQVVVVDEHANVRITGPPIPPQRKREDPDSRPVSQRSQASTLQTQNSTGVSTTSRTIATSSTRKSDNVGTLAPDAVAHLIGNQVGGMTFDKEQQRWVRVSKSPEKLNQGSFLELPSNVTSDDDPFREISDLQVDEVKELRRLSSSGKRGGQPPGDVESVDQSAAAPSVELESASQETVVTRPVTRDSSHVKHMHSSSVVSKYTALASSQQEAKVETRATSWSDEELAKMSAHGRTRQGLSTLDEAQPMSDDSVVHVPTRQDVMPKASSPVKDKLPPQPTTPGRPQQPQKQRSDDDGLDDDVADPNISSTSGIHSPKRRQTPMHPPSSAHPSTRQMSLRKRTLTSRFHRVDNVEQSELSIIAPLPGDRVMSLSLSVSRPVSKRQQAGEVTEVQSSPIKGDSSFVLSDLSDFTVHEEDKERPSERALASRLAQHAAVEVNDRYAVAIKELVKILTDVNEDEPYWEDLKRLDLHNRSLGSLYGLNDFCTGVQDMNVSNNTLQHLQGAPATLRRLDVSSNLLSGLTSWNHLMNLQYLDISNNHLESLDGLHCLIHLRELRADDNRITQLDGISGLDGLLKLRLRRNKIESLRLSNSRLIRLTHLDVCDNQVTSIDGLKNLSSLTDLKMDNNPIGDGINSGHVLPQLRSLSLKNCGMSHLDVTRFPNLTHLNVDDNHLNHIHGIESLLHLDTLSMRRQDLVEGESLAVLESGLEASTVYLSGNQIPTLYLSTPLLNLRHLELASTGLHTLPLDFGLLVPNLRSLNLNFNSLRDLRPLLNLPRLQQLLVCGNRISRLRKSIATLEKLRGLRRLDLRGNPLTLGFYANASLQSVPASKGTHRMSLIRNTRDSTLDKNHNDDEEEERQACIAAEKARYELPASSATAIEDDMRHRARLDEETALRRRVYELLLANGCAELKELDGLRFDRVKAVRERDFVWERLLDLGVLRRSGRGVVGVGVDE